MYKKIFDNFIIETISQYDRTIKITEKHIENTLARIVPDSELAEIASMPGRDFGSITYECMHDITETYEKYLNLKKEQMNSIRASIRADVEKQETMNRIMACYNALPLSEHKVLEYLYERYGYKEGLKKLVEDTNRTKATILRHRSKAMEHIKKMYNSELSSLDIYKADKNKINEFR